MSYISGAWNVHCKDCNIEKDISNFYMHSNGKPRKQCKICVLARRSKINPDIVKRAKDKYRANNHKKVLAKFTEWRRANLEYDRYRVAYRRLLVKQQTPVWANKDIIKKIYLNCPANFHVDHVIPLRGKIVCGLHIETNLQYLTATENLAKRNLYV